MLRICYWYGAILDTIVGLQYIYSVAIGPFRIIPGLEGLDYSIASNISNLSNGYKLAMGWCASCCFGGLSLIIWAYQKPVERRAIILLILFAIIGFSLTVIVIIFTK